MNPPGGACIFDRISYTDRCRIYLLPIKIKETGDVNFDNLLIQRLAHQKRNIELSGEEHRNTDYVNWWTDITIDSLHPIGRINKK